MIEDAAPLSIPAQRLLRPARADMAEPVRLTELLEGALGEGRRLYYVWMDFFMTREGQAHLRGHTPRFKASSSEPAG